MAQQPQEGVDCVQFHQEVVEVGHGRDHVHLLDNVIEIQLRLHEPVEKEARQSSVGSIGNLPQRHRGHSRSWERAVGGVGSGGGDNREPHGLQRGPVLLPQSFCFSLTRKVFLNQAVSRVLFLFPPSFPFPFASLRGIHLLQSCPPSFFWPSHDPSLLSRPQCPPIAVLI